MSLDLAIRLAQERTLIETRGSSSISRMCCVAVSSGITLVGHNSYRSHPLVRFFRGDPQKGDCLHAEISALVKIINYETSRKGRHRRDFEDLDFSDWSIYIARVLADGSPALSLPCIACQKAINKFNIKKIFWTISFDKFGYTYKGF